MVRHANADIHGITHKILKQNLGTNLQNRDDGPKPEIVDIWPHILPNLIQFGICHSLEWLAGKINSSQEMNYHAVFIT